MKVFTKKRLRGIQIFWSIFIGLGAYLGAFMMISDPSGIKYGMAPMLPLFEILPFSEIFFEDFLTPGILLLIINGLTNTFSLILLLRHSKYAAFSGLCCGIILMLWICVQFVIFPFNILSTVYFIFGFLQTVNGCWLMIKSKAF